MGEEINELIPPNAVMLDILKEIHGNKHAKKIEFKITKPVLLKNQKIVEKSREELLNPSPYTENIISPIDDDIAVSGPVRSLNLVVDGEKLLTGNFLAIFEDWYFISCTIITSYRNISRIKTVITKYKRFNLSVIASDLNLFNDVKHQIYLNPISVKLKEELIRLGAYCYLNNNNDNLTNAFDTLRIAEKSVAEKYSGRNKNLADEIFLLISIIKYHIYRLYKDENDKNSYYDKVLASVNENLNELSDKSNSQLRFSILRHNAYLKALIDGENYNYHKGRATVIHHGGRAAVTAIMARNLSHNIGSHVISYLVQNIQELGITNSNDHSRFYQYLQHRMDFVAEITTSGPSWEMSMDFVLDIMTEFKEFEAAEASQNSRAEERYSPQEIILKYICHSEGVTLDDDSFRIYAHDECKRVSIPNGVVGKHAFYSILENFIRNAAKHYRGESPKPFKIMIELIPPSRIELQEDFIEVRIWDARKDSCYPIERSAGHKGDYKCVADYLQTFVDEGGKHSALINEEDGSLAPGGWGLKEMRISAAFLRHYDAKDVVANHNENKLFDPPLLRVLCGKSERCLDSNIVTAPCEDCGGQLKHLGFSFYLKKPKDLMVISSGCSADGKSFHIQWGTEESVTDRSDTKAVTFKKHLPHKLLLVPQNDLKMYADSPHMPCRVMGYESDESNKLNDDLVINKYEQFICEQVLRSTNQLPKLVTNLKRSFQFAKKGEASKYAIYLFDNPSPEVQREICQKNIYFEHHPQISLDQNKYFFFQPISGAYSTKMKLQSLNSIPEPIRTQIYLELIEAALVQVVIVDERISEWASGNGAWGKKIREILIGMNIHVPEVGRDNFDLASIKRSLSSVENNNWRPFGIFHEDVDCNAHFFVIHQGILNKMGSDVDTLMKEVKCRWKVVDSGRGVPEELPANVRFVEISALQQLLMNYDKHSLVQVLFSSRNPVKGKVGG